MSKTCANCGAGVPEGAGFCDNCGMPVSEVPTQGAPPRETPTQQPPAASPTPPLRPSSPPVPPPSVERPASDPPSSQGALRGGQPSPARREEAPPLSAPSQPASSPPLSPPPLVDRPQIPVPPPPPQGERSRRGLLILGGLLAFVGIGIAIWLLVADTQGGNEVAEGPPTEEAPPAEEAPKPAPGYQLVDDGLGNLTLEVPSGWEVITGDESEGDPTQLGWSTFTEVDIASSITASSDLETWNTPGGAAPGIYAVASRELAQQYADSELAVSGPNDGSTYRCQPGESRNLDRSSYSGVIQAWDCGGNGDVGSKAFYTLSAGPQDRECVVALQVWAYGEADREAAQQILDTFEVDCGGI